MIFNYYNDSFKCSNNKFLSRNIVVVGSPRVIIKDKKLFPYSYSADGKNLYESLRKYISEYNERFAISTIYFKSDNVKYINLMNGNTDYCSKKKLSYGKNDLYGYIDTTGVSANSKNSKANIKKAISELIEKNELAFFWYFDYGKRIDINNKVINRMIQKYGLEKYELYFFKIDCISNWSTVLGIAYLNGRMISTGICCHEYFYSALSGALNELRIVRVLNSFKNYNLFDNVNSLEIYEKIKFFKDNDKLPFNINNYNYLKAYDIRLNKIVLNLNVSYISSNNSSKIVTVFSDNLIKCLPTISNLSWCKNIDIIKLIKWENISKTMDCIIV